MRCSRAHVFGRNDEKTFSFHSNRVLSCLPIELKDGQTNFCYPEGAEPRKILPFLNKTISLSCHFFLTKVNTYDEFYEITVTAPSGGLIQKQ